MNGTEYAGPHNITKSGQVCQAQGSETKGICAKPDSAHPHGPWCYVNDSDISWEYCNIPMCGKEIHWNLDFLW